VRAISPKVHRRGEKPDDAGQREHGSAVEHGAQDAHRQRRRGKRESGERGTFGRRGSQREHRHQHLAEAERQKSHEAITA